MDPMGNMNGGYFPWTPAPTLQELRELRHDWAKEQISRVWIGGNLVGFA